MMISMMGTRGTSLKGYDDSMWYDFLFFEASMGVGGGIVVGMMHGRAKEDNICTENIYCFDTIGGCHILLSTPHRILPGRPGQESDEEIFIFNFTHL